MCIRDRLKGAFGAEGSGVDDDGVTDADRVVVPGGVVGAEAVSYTHLRAHETVLDLVCRLLLEKTKEMKSTHNV